MPRFVIRDAAFFFVVEAAALSFRSGDDFFDRVFEIALRHFVSTAPGGRQGRFVDRVGQIGS